MAYQAAWFAKKVARSNVPPYQPLMKASPHLREKSPIRQGCLTNGATLETEFSDGKANETVVIWHQAIPLNQQIIGCDRESQMGFEILPDMVNDPLDMTNSCQHG